MCVRVCVRVCVCVFVALSAFSLCVVVYISSEAGHQQIVKCLVLTCNFVERLIVIVRNWLVDNVYARPDNPGH